MARETEARYRELFHGLPVGLYRFAPDGRIVEVNPALAEMLGYPDMDALRAMNAAELYADPAERPARLAAIEREGVLRDVELQLRRRDGKTIWVRNNARVVRDQEGRTLFYEGSVEDVTRTRLATAELEARARQQAAVADLGRRALAGAGRAKLMAEAVHVVADALGVEYAKVLELLPDGRGLLLRAGVGWKPGLVGHATVEAERGSQAGYTLLQKEPVVVEDLPAETRFTVPRLLAEHHVTSGISVVIEGRPRPFGVFGAHSARPRVFTAGDVNFVRAVADILAMAIAGKRARRALGASEERYRALIETSIQGVHIHQDGVFRFVNPAWARIFGYAHPEEIVGHPYGIVVAPRERARLEGLRQARLRSEPVPTRVEFEGIRKDGSPVWVETLVTVTSWDGAPAILATVLDVTERRRIEAALRESEARFRSAFEDAAVGMAVQDLEGRYLRVNQALCTILGYSSDELLATAFTAPTHPDDREADHAYNRRMLAGEIATYQHEKRYLHRDGHIVWALANVSLVRGPDGRPAHYIVQVQDVSERRRAEAELARQREALLQREKVAVMGQLLAGVAHELNNPLAVVVGQTALLRRTVAEGAVGGRIDKIAEAAERCARIVRNFLAMARQRSTERREASLNQVVDGAIDLLAYPLRVDDVGVTCDLAPDLPLLWADPHQLQQVVVNLVTNAHQAVRGAPPPRRLTVTTRAGSGAGRVILEVRDSGPGIPPEHLGRVFEPFFTTKPAGHGTGLGLSLCRGIVDAHGGTIGIDSRAGEGTVVRVELPVGAPPAVGADAPGEEAAPVPGGRTILVVDDEPDVANLLADLLAIDGHRVETAANGRFALERLEERSYDLIVSDLRMPELDGPGLYREVERRAPALARRFVFVTGDALSPEAARFLEQTRAPSIGKPFALDDVRRALGRVLGRQPG